VLDAVNQALSSPLLDTSIAGARGVLCNIVGGEDIGIGEVNDGVSQVTELVDPEANIIVGAVTDPTIMSGEVKVTLIATGFDHARPHVQRARPQPAPAQEAPARPEPPQHTPQPTPRRPRLQRIRPLARPEEEPGITPEPPAPPEPSLRAAVGSNNDDMDLMMPPFLRNRTHRRNEDVEPERNTRR
jgi:cell division protein FtsZ